MIDLSGISSLQVAADRLGGLRSFLFQRGDPAQIAGDPDGIRKLAEHHRASAGRLGAMTERAGDRVSRVLAASWHGDASARFGGYWSDLERRLGALAAAHQAMADRLEQVAEDSARLNREVTALLGETEGWLGRAAAALAARDVRVAGWLAADGMTLVVRWERLLREVEAFAEGIGRRLQASLDFPRRPVAMGQRLPQLQPPIDLPPPLPGSALAGRPSEQGSPMADRRRVGPGGRRQPLPVPPAVQRRRLPPGTSPEGWRPRRPGQPGRPRRPPSGPLPRTGSGAGSEPRRKPVEPVPRPGGAPVKIPTVGVPHPLPAGPHHHPGISPLPTPVDTYIFQLVTLGVLAGQQVKREVQRRRERKKGKNGGGSKGGGARTGSK